MLSGFENTLNRNRKGQVLYGQAIGENEELWMHLKQVKTVQHIPTYAQRSKE